jgi:predicted Rossmann fold flavoprotein
VKKKRIAIIGGGPAGLMAAGQAAASGADVSVFERNIKPARKLAITGKGRCNLTNKADLEQFIGRFGSNGKFLKPSFYHFFSDDLIKFFGQLGVSLAFERGGRVFPESGDAGEVVTALVNWARGKGVKLIPDARVRKLILDKNKVIGLRYSSGKDRTEKVYLSDKIVLATGGTSYPGTGSTGDGYRIAEEVGHSIVSIRPALVPLKTEGDIAGRLQGLSLKNVKLKLLVDGKKKAEIFGEMLFTHFGLSGPIVLTISKQAVDFLNENRKVGVSLDLKPALDEKKLDNRILRDFDSNRNKKIKSALKLLLPRKLIPICLQLAGINGDKLCNQISTVERRKLKLWLKDFRFDICGHRSFGEAIITAGGISLKEVNPKSLESRLVRNLYFAGEVLDIDAETGGFNLQAAFSTGYLAGISASGRII